eukprot:scpid74562/ scgid13605/ Elongation of very long chain fatty acids protein 4; 3-keto acyl-CoA synthase Elovl4; ELOVL fatty acid elongase 4
MADRRDHVLSVASAWLAMPSFSIMCVYLGMVLIVSPIWRRVVPALSLGYMVVAYNALCSALSLVTLLLFFVPLAAGWEASMFSIERCKTEYMALAFQLYYYTKVIELLDTVWMILRHKSRQITVLHVYHHSIMAVLGDAAYMTSLPGVAFGLGMNSAVHVVMYMYYLVTAWRSMSSTTGTGGEGTSARNPAFLFSPFMERILPLWRQRMTEMQLLQFFIGGVHNLWGYKYHSFCPYGSVFLFTLVVLFSNFYYRAYLKPKRKQPPVDTKKSE